MVFFIHGGGYYRGNVSSTRSAAAEMGRACRARALSIGYRKAPEHPFPAAIDDVLAGYQGLLATGVSSSQVVVGGISAGGGLTAALLLALKRDGGAMPAGAVPISPWLDLTQTAETYTSKADADPSISKDYLDRMAGYYLGGADARTPLASPLFGDLTDLPPQLVQVGAAETLMDDSVAYARALVKPTAPCRWKSTRAPYMVGTCRHICRRRSRRCAVSVVFLTTWWVRSYRFSRPTH